MLGRSWSFGGDASGFQTSGAKHRPPVPARKAKPQSQHCLLQHDFFYLALAGFYFFYFFYLSAFMKEIDSENNVLTRLLPQSKPNKPGTKAESCGLHRATNIFLFSCHMVPGTFLSALGPGLPSSWHVMAIVDAKFSSPLDCVGVYCLELETYRIQKMVF